MTRIFHRFLCERWIPCQASTSVLWLHYRPETIHCSTKDVYTSEITFLALQSLQSTIFKIEKAPEYILQSNRLIWDLWHWFGQFAVFFVLKYLQSHSRLPIHLGAQCTANYCYAHYSGYFPGLQINKAKLN